MNPDHALPVSQLPTGPLAEREPAPGWEGFKVPLGSAPDGNLVPARRASRETVYHCPGCGSVLQLRSGSVRAPHFAHQRDGFCSQETALHQGAKLLLAQLLRGCTRGRRTRAPRLRVPCAGFPRPEGAAWVRDCPGRAWLPLWALAFDEVAVERGTPDGLRPDVLLLREGLPVLGIEVLVTHAVDRTKAARTAHPWVELEALALLRAPRSWIPAQADHPWRGTCRVCAGAGGAELSEVVDPGDCQAQLGAACLEAHLQAWLRRRSTTPKPAIHWRCPWCRKPNLRSLRRDRIRAAGLATGLGPPIHAQVILHGALGPTIIAFGFPADPLRPMAIAPLPQGPPALRVTPGLDHPYRLALNGTNTPLGFICGKCGRDCLGVLPSPWMPMPQWQCL